MKKWPWVSREHLDDTKRMLQTRVDELEAERKRLLDILLGGAVPDRRAAVARVEAPEVETVRPAEINPEQVAPVSYSTPFDRTLAKFDQAHKGGTIPAEFKARMN